jgi:hypothetical protein
MLSNPVIEQLEKAEKEARERDAFRHTFSVVCVVAYTDQIPSLNAFHIVKKFCDENHVAFSCREYDAHRYYEDRDNIERLPAFHLMCRRTKELWGTYHVFENPIQKIQDEIKRHWDQERRRRERREAWQKKVTGLVEFFENLSFKKKPKLKDPLPSRPKSLPPKIPLEFLDSQAAPRKRSL